MIELRGVSKSFGGPSAVCELSVAIDKGSFFVLAVPSGCGKTTVLRMINALIAPDKGEILVRGQDVRQVEPESLRRSIGYVIQSGGLFPHWRVADNILAVPRLLGWSKAKCEARLGELVALLHIKPALIDRYPGQLSGGEQQRIGVARALAADPDIILMDEPFAALDPVSRTALQDELRAIHAQTGKTIVFVTHDMDEALRLATGLGLMREGRLLQSGSPASLLNAPGCDFVRDFLGGKDLPLRQLEPVPVRALLRRRWTSASVAIPADATLKDALRMMLAKHCASLLVEDENGARIGEIRLSDILARRDQNRHPPTSQA